MIILNACDAPFWKHSRALLGSIAKNTDHTANFTLIQNQRKGEEWQKDYCANFRTALICATVHGKVPALWLDSDSIVRASLAPLEKMLREEVDVISVYTPEMSGGGYEPNEWLISTVGVSNSTAGRAFAIRWLEIQINLQNSPGYAPSIMTCQEAFVKAVKEFQKNPGPHNVRIRDIGYAWSDKFMREESPIWEAQGPTRKEDPKWLAEQARYL